MTLIKTLLNYRCFGVEDGMCHKFCGIDFGTTNSAVSILDNNTSKLVQFENKDTIPTAIFFFGGLNRKPVFGREAVREYVNGTEGRFMRSIKRILGTDLMDVKTEINKKMINYEDVIYCFIKHLKDNAEQKINSKLDNVVLGRPVHFQDFAPELDVKAEDILRKVAKRVGFNEVNFLYEPLAAAYSHEINLESEQLACVIDIGGGTSDFSVVRLGGARRTAKNRQSDILANDGMRIGGNDFDFNLSISCFMPRFGYGTQLKPNVYNDRVLPVPSSPYILLSEWSSINTLYTYKERKNIQYILENAAEPEKIENLYEIVTKELGHILLNNIEETKIALTEQNEIIKKLEFLSAKPEIYVKSKEFEYSIAQNVDKIKAVLQNCIKQAGVSPKQISLIILTGGSTAIPYVKKVFSDFFPQAQISEEFKLSSVASGLAYEAQRLYK